MTDKESAALIAAGRLAAIARFTLKGLDAEASERIAPGLRRAVDQYDAAVVELQSKRGKRRTKS